MLVVAPGNFPARPCAKTTLVKVIVFNATFTTISVISWRRKPEYPDVVYVLCMVQFFMVS
jgi:hypothetical protein